MSQTIPALTTRQAIAHASPCYVAEDILKPRFTWRRQLGDWGLSCVLTVNVGLE